MKNLTFTLAFLLLAFLSSSQIPTCDVELLDLNWDNKEITLTLNDNNCESTPTWVPTNDSVYTIQMWFTYDGWQCSIASNNANFNPNLGLNDTITYSFENWNDPFNCFESAFEYYIETCEGQLTVLGANNTVSIDANISNNYIAYNPIWDNCYNTLNINEYTRNSAYSIYDAQGNFMFECNTIPWSKMNGLFFIKEGETVSKYFKNSLDY